MIIPDKRIAEVVSRLTGVSREELNRGLPLELPLPDFPDSLDTAMLMLELEAEFDKETVQWAVRFILAMGERSRPRRSKRPASSRPEGPDPLWDRELDG